MNQTNIRRIGSNFLGSASGYQDDPGSSDDEEEAIAVDAEGTSGFGRHVRAERTWIQKHDKSSNFTMCLLSRMYNSRTKCFVLLALSCVLLATGVPRSTWSLLLSLGIVYKRAAVEEMLLDIGEERIKWSQGGSKSIGFCVSDNCAYNTKIVYQHAERDGHFIKTVKYLYFPIGSLLDGTVPELPASDEYTLD